MYPCILIQSKHNFFQVVCSLCKVLYNAATCTATMACVGPRAAATSLCERLQQLVNLGPQAS